LGIQTFFVILYFFIGQQWNDILKSGLELGRSFVQPRYWGRRSLDYLWYGIGAFLCNNPEYRYLLGPVSISNKYPIAAKDMLVYFYRLKFLGYYMGCTVPTLYKQYTEMCQEDGVHFLDFNIDPDFANCIDGLVVVDLNLLSDKTRQRYIENDLQ